MADTGKLMDGRTYGVNDGGIDKITRRYEVILDAIPATNGERTTFPGVPAIGSKHPTYTNLTVKRYDVEEGKGANKKVTIVNVIYEPTTEETSGEGEEEQTFQVDEWGWDDGADEKELTEAADGTPVLNSAGDPFESVPKVSVPAPTFTKVMKFQDRQSGWNSCNCKVNAEAVTIGGISCPIGSLLCSVSEKRLLGDPIWRYQYTVHLKLKSNPVKLQGADTATDVGWDVAITDAGMRALNDDDKLEIIRMPDPETKKMCTVTTPCLLNGEGRAQINQYADQGPYNFRFQAYARATIPSWFYSEPL